MDSIAYDRYYEELEKAIAPNRLTYGIQVQDNMIIEPSAF